MTDTTKCGSEELSLIFSGLYKANVWLNFILLFFSFLSSS